MRSMVTLRRLRMIIALVLCAASAETSGNFQSPLPGQRTPAAGAKVFDAEQLILEKLDSNSKIALLLARKSVSQHGGITLGLEHFAIGLLQVLGPTVPSILKPGASVEQLVEELAGAIPASAHPEEADKIRMDRHLGSLLERAAQQAAVAGAPTVSPRVLLLAILEGPETPTRDVLSKAGMTPEAVRRLTIQ